MNFDIVYEGILKKNKITKNFLFNVLEDLKKKGVSYGDIYFQDYNSEILSLENKIIKFNLFNVIKGISIRAIFFDRTIFACSSEISENSILNLIYKINGNLSCVKNINNLRILVNDNNLVKINNFYESIIPIGNLYIDKRVDLLFYLDNYIRKIDNCINYVSVELCNSYEIILVVSTDGVFIGDIRPLVKLLIKVQVEKNGYSEFGYSGGGGRYSFDDLLNKKVLNDKNCSIFEYWASEAVRIAINNLVAVNPPFGKMPVILGSGSPGILFHEAVGHGLEGDFNRKGVSCFKNKIGCKIASSLCTIIDDGSIKGSRGTLNIDDEGVFSRRNILIKNGILKSYMLDKLNANLMNLVSTGNSRRESYLFLPVPRMTNTYLKGGKSTLNDMISSVDYGLYVVSLGSGQVDITSGKFVFTILEAYMIKNGKVKCSVKGITLIGSGIEVMNKISMVGNDLKFDSGLGTCCKDGQNVPVSVGQPSIKIESMVIGCLN